ncbi:vacuolar membrane-associated protein iml1 [Batrachochytrium dendrobatidis]|nr:vacuolar membrane-associated protein iml1 [Batrachochytrium dendrobatidis]
MQRISTTENAQILNLWVHDERYSHLDVVINPIWFPGVQLGDLFEIYPAEQTSGTTQPSSNVSGSSNTRNKSLEGLGTSQLAQKYTDSNVSSETSFPQSNNLEFQDILLKNRLILQVSAIDQELVAKQPQLQEIAQHIATLFELNARTNVVARKVDKESVTASFVEVTFRDQYIGRTDMWRLKMSLTGTALYYGKQVLTLGIRGQVKDIIINGGSAKCCYVSDSTKTIFRSETAKYFIFIQMSREMWEFDEDGELYFEKCVHGFLPELFARWKEIGANHVVSIVLFARIHQVDIAAFDLKSKEQSVPIYYSADGQPCRDYYRVVVDRETYTDWSQLLIPLKKEFVRFQRDVLEQKDASGTTMFSGTNSLASEGNILEAINLALNPFDKHYVDRDLMRTGLSIVVVTPGTGYFEVDKRLCRLTWQRMVDNGIGLDLVCLAKPPLYTVPLFQFASYEAVSSVNPSNHLTPMTAACPSRVSPSSFVGSRNSHTANPNDLDTDQRSIHTSGSAARSDRFNSEPAYFGRSCGSERKPEVWDPLYSDEDSILGGRLGSFYTVPNWVDCSFWNRSKPKQTSLLRSGDASFVSRCRMYEVQMMGFVEQVETKINVPYLDQHFDGLAIHQNGDMNSPKDVGISISTLESFDFAQYDAGLFVEHHDAANSAMTTPTSTQTQPQQNQHRSNFSTNSQNASLFSFTDMRSQQGLRSRLSPDPNGDFSQSGSRNINIETAHETGVGNGTDALYDSRHQPHSGSMVQRMSLTRNSRATTSLAPMTPIHFSHGPSSRLESRDRTMRLSGSLKDREYGRNFDKHMLERVNRGGNRESNHAIPEFTHLSIVDLQPIQIRPHNQLGHANYTGTSATGDKTMGYVSGARSSYSGSGSYKEINSPVFDNSKHFSKISPGRSIHFTNRQTMRQNYVNPCNPIKNVIRASSQARRWEHIFPKSVMKARDVAWTNWKPLCRPACMPLTTEFFPSPDEILELYQEYTYTVLPAEDINFHSSTDEQQNKKVENLLIELISQRLAQGFQLVVSTVQDGPQKFPGTPAPASRVGAVNALTNAQMAGGPRSRASWSPHRSATSSYQHVYQPTFTFSTTTPYYVSLGDHVHRLFYDALGNNVEIKRYIRKIGYNTEGITYPCAIWSKHRSGYELRTASFTYPSLATYNWNYLDHLVAGYQEKMTDALRYWRTRFLLIPTETLVTSSILMSANNDTLDEEEVRIAAFNKFIDALEKVRWVPPSETVSNGKTTRSIQVQHTSFDASAFVKSELSRAGDTVLTDVASNRRRTSVSALSSFMSMTSIPISLTERLNRSCSLSEIAIAMQQSNGPSFKDRRWHFTRFERVCVGSEFVDWLVRCFLDINTRDEAVQFGNYLLENGVIQHAYRKHKFMDGFYFYNVGKGFDNEALHEKILSQSGWFGTGKGNVTVAKTSSIDLSGGLPTIESIAASSLSSIQAGSVLAQQQSILASPLVSHASIPSPAPPDQFCISRQINIDMDPQRKSTRQERAVLHYDTTHNPKNCYHIQLHWLVCTPRLIEDMLRSWGRIAEKCSLKLVEAPMEQPQMFSDDNPFQSVILVPLSLMPPKLSEVISRLGLDIDVPPMWFEAELVRSQNFVLDIESDLLFPKDKILCSFTPLPYLRTQYVHRSGVALVQLCEEGKFMWAENRVFLAGNSNTSGSGATSRNSPDALLAEFCRICQDIEFLKSFWIEAEKRLQSLSQPGETVSCIKD